MERERLRSVLRALACVFLVFHLAAITIANVPRSTALGAGFHRPFDAYTRFFGVWQRWDMFTTIPHHHTLDFRLTGRDEHGRDLRYGPTLPTFGKASKYLRLQALFARLTFWRHQYVPYARRYFLRACDVLEAHTGKRPASVGLEVRAERLRPLHAIRADGRIAEKKTLRFKEERCP